MSYTGMDAITGRRLDGVAHLQQSVGKVLGTAIGERLRRRPFGSLAPDLVDSPTNTTTLLQLLSASATALLAWEPRLKVRHLSAQADAAMPGRLIFTIDGEALLDDVARPVSLMANVGA